MNLDRTIQQVPLNNVSHSLRDPGNETMLVPYHILCAIGMDHRARRSKGMRLSAMGRRQQEYARLTILLDTAEIHDLRTTRQGAERKAVADRLAPGHQIRLQSKPHIGARQAG